MSDLVGNPNCWFSHHAHATYPFCKKCGFLEIVDPAKSFTDIKIGLSRARRDVRLKNQSCLFLLQCHAENSKTVLHYYSVCTSISTAKYASFYNKKTFFIHIRKY